MTKFRFFLILSFSSILSIISFGQPQPCAEPVEMTSLCADACVICDIDGFTGRHSSTIIGEAPPGFEGECTVFLHNAQWIAFIAGSTNLSVSLAVSNCQLATGLELGIYAGDECGDFRRVSNCFGGAVGIIAPGQSGVVTTNEPLVIGQYYYLVMDGAFGDNCDWTFSVLEGSTQVLPISPINSIDGLTNVCPNVLTTFEVPEREGATEHQWTVNGNLEYEDGPIFDWSFDATGNYNVCYTAFNVCDTLATICKQVSVTELPPMNFNEEICDTECFSVLDTTICDAGFHSFEIIEDDGCIQEVNITISIIPPIFTELELNFCFGDSVMIGTESFFETGSYEIPIETNEVCDSIVLLDITTFLCDIDGGFADDSLLCNGNNDGALVFNLLDGEFPFQYEWEEVTGSGLIGLGSSTSTNSQVVIPDLTTGIYSVTIVDNAGSLGIFIGQVFEPFPIGVDATYSDYNGFNISCPDAADGSLTLDVSGGNEPYSFVWENGLNEASATGLAAGNYPITVLDVNGCELILNEVLTEAEPISLSLDLLEPICNPDESGAITVSNITGGTAPHLFSLNGEPFSVNPDFQNLVFGDYTLQVEDTNGCQIDTSIIFTDPNTLFLDIGLDTTICLGDSILLSPFVNSSDVIFAWEEQQGIRCLDCPRTYVRPFNNSIYTLTASLPNGCERTDSLSVLVIQKREIYIPNAFSPNGDGRNDEFEIYAGQEVAQVRNFSVFNRWGAVVAEEKNFQANTIGKGWDGRFKGELMDAGIYVWMAEVEFLDGEVIVYKGDVLLIK